MGVPIAPTTGHEPVDPVARMLLRTRAPVLFVEADERGRATARLQRETATRYRGRFLLVPPDARDDLLSALPLANDWLTVPLTPQQVTAALTRVVRQPGLAPHFDPETGLRLADLTLSDRPALEILPAEGISRFEAAWFLKRFSRGYDEPAIAGDRIVLLPRAVSDHLPAVVRRLEHVFEGRAAVRPLPKQPPRRRLDAAG
jgi:hypothetical protein